MENINLDEIIYKLKKDFKEDIEMMEDSLELGII
jgi:hypothetical protein